MARIIFKTTLVLSAAIALAACDQLKQFPQRQEQPLTMAEEIPLNEVVSSQLAPLSLNGQDYLLLASEVRGLVLLNADGSEAVSLDGGTVERFALQQQNENSWLVAVYDEDTGELQLRLLDMDPETKAPRLRYLGAQRMSAPQTALCFSRQADRPHLFAIDETGLGHEYVVHPREQAWEFTELRPLYFGEQVSGCVVDDRNERLLVAQPPLGIWSLNADAEQDEERSVFAAGGALGEDFAGLWLDGVSGQLWFAAEDRVVAYDARNPERGPLFRRALAELEPVSVAVQQGHLLALAEEADRVQRFNIELPQPPAEIQTFRGPAEIPRVGASAQTAPVLSGGDAADDPAIWVNPKDVTASLILGTDKKSGLHVYNLSGQPVAQFEVGRLNNVDLRSVNHGKFSALAAASNRTDPGISLFGITAAGSVEYLGVRNMDLTDPYGLCLYKYDGQLLAWISDKNGDLHLVQIVPGEGDVDWQLQPRGKLTVASQVEGCVVDDERGTLFFGEEDGGIWRLDIAAFLQQGAKPQLVAPVDGERLVADVEGIGLYHNGERSYLVVSSQGNNSYALFSRDGSEYVGSFRVDMNLDRGLDGSSETDGLEVTSAPLGDGYPAGLLIVQDGRNRMPASSQNFKLVSWADIQDKLKLP